MVGLSKGPSSPEDHILRGLKGLVQWVPAPHHGSHCPSGAQLSLVPCSCPHSPQDTVSLRAGEAQDLLCRLWIPVTSPAAGPLPPHPTPYSWLPHSWPLSLRLVLECRAGLSGQGLWGPEFCALFTGLWPCQSAGADSLPQSAGLFWKPHEAVAQASLWTSILGPSWGGQGSWPEPLSSPVQFQSRAQWVISLKGCSLSVAQTHPTGHTQGTEGGSGQADGTASQVHASQQQPARASSGNTLKEGPRQVVPMRTAGETVKLDSGTCSWTLHGWSLGLCMPRASHGAGYLRHCSRETKWQPAWRCTVLFWGGRGSLGRPAREDTPWRCGVCSAWLRGESLGAAGLTGRPVLGGRFTEPLPCSRHVTYDILCNP